MNHTGKNAILLMTGKALTSLMSMLSVMMLARVRTLEEYGTYAQMNTVINIVVVLFVLGLPNAINYFWAGQKEKQQRANFANTYFSMITVLGGLCGAALVIATPLLVAYFENPLLKNYWYYLLLIPLTKVFLESRSIFMVASEQAKRLVFYNFTNALMLLGSVVIVEAFNASFREYLILFVCIEVFFSALVLYEVNRTTGRLRFSLERKIIKNVLTFSLPIGLSAAVNTLKQECDKLMVSYFFSTREMALYTNAAHELPITLIATSMSAVLLPKVIGMIREKRYEDAVDLWKRGIQLTLSVLTFFVIGMFVYAEDVIRVLYSEAYIESVPVFRLYLLMHLAKCTYFGMLLNACGKTSVILKAAVFSLLLNILLNVAGYYALGFVGPAVATVIVSIFSAVYQLCATSKLVNIKFGQIFPWKGALKIVAVNALFGCVFYGLKLVLPIETLVGSEVESILLAIVWGLTYGGAFFKKLKADFQALV